VGRGTVLCHGFVASWKPAGDNWRFCLSGTGLSATALADPAAGVRATLELKMIRN
jgi:hypothetical protein